MKPIDNIPSSFNLSSLSAYSADVEKLPPVEQWDPDYCGEMDLLLKANGEWLHHGTPMGRKKMVTLFSRILKKENEQYFLVSPVEKIGIKVEWQPFVIIDFKVVQHDNQPCFVFMDNCDNRILLTEPEQIQFSDYQNESLPIVKVRRNLYASFSRSCYYRLIEQAEIIEEGGAQIVQISSSGKTFSLGVVSE